MLYDYKGTVFRIGPVQTVGQKGFQKREIVLEPETQGKFPTYGIFVLKGKDNVGKADGIAKGDSVIVKFAVDGRGWDDPKTGKTRFFSELTAVKVEKVGGAQPSVSVPDAPVPPDDFSAADEDLPF